MLLVCDFAALRAAKSHTNCRGQIAAAQFQPTAVGFVVPAEAFRPAGSGVQYVLDHNTLSIQFILRVAMRAVPALYYNRNDLSSSIMAPPRR